MDANELTDKIATIVARAGIDYRPMCQNIARAVLASGLVVPTSDVLNLAQTWQERGDFGRDDTDYLMGRSDGHRDAAAELRALTQQES